MKSKLIIIVLSILLIISIITNIILFTKLDKSSSDATNNKLVGIYHTNNYNNKGIESNLILSSDKTCTYFDDKSSSCTYTASDDNISITLTNYNVADNRGLNYSFNFYPTLQECDVELKRLSDANKGTELLCKKSTYKHTLTATNNGYLLDNDLLLTKIK